jgi:GTP-binding protein
MSGAPLQLKFIRSATSGDALPPGPREVAVVGRSNVGKSSLINALANQKALAHVSNTPGRTQLINQFQLRRNGKDLGIVVDLPGYGYAKVPQKVRDAWRPMIEGYLTQREELVMVFVLVDGEVGPTKLDQQMLDWLRSLEIDHQVIATKADRVKATKRPIRVAEVAAGCQLDANDVLWVSASKGTNIDVLRGRFMDLIGTNDYN